MRLVFDHDITQMLHADDQHPVEQFAAEVTAGAFIGAGHLPCSAPADQLVFTMSGGGVMRCPTGGARPSCPPAAAPVLVTVSAFTICRKLPRR
jgi:hypothetical protein